MVCDFHCHVLPGIDDGASGSEQALQMIEAAVGQNITCMVATPHFYANHDDPQRFLRRRSGAEERLRQQLPADSPELRVGAEVYYFEGISDCGFLPQLAISGTRCVLIEMPNGHWNDRMFAELTGIYRKRGLTPIIAHLDRYLTVFNREELVERIRAVPALIQVNASFFLHWQTRRMALKMLKNRQIDLLGSDCHNLTDRPENLQKAVQVITRALGEDALERVYRKERQALSGERVV